MNEMVRCGGCGIRYRSRHEKCPKCRARDPQEVAAQEPAPPAPAPAGGADRRRQIVLGVCGSLLLVALVGGWMFVAPQTDTASAATTLSAPMSRVLKGDNQASLKVPVRVPAEVAFIDSPAAGRRDYAAGNLDGALARFKDQMAAQPKNAEPYSNAGQILVKIGRPGEAVSLLEKAAELDPGRWAYRFNLARAEGLLGNWDKAAFNYAEAVALFPGDYATLFNLGQALHRAGREEEAVGRYREAIKQKPDDASFYLALAVSEDKLGHAAEAASAYRQFASLEPTARQAEAVLSRAKTLEERK
jgi:tetratricopeptide (TPR) repeat protein